MAVVKMDQLQQLVETLRIFAPTNEPNRVVLIEKARIFAMLTTGDLVRHACAILGAEPQHRGSDPAGRTSPVSNRTAPSAGECPRPLDANPLEGDRPVRIGDQYTRAFSLT